MILESILVALVTYVIYLFLRYPNRAIGTHARPDLKGPPGSPIFGNLSFLRENALHSLEAAVRLNREYGRGYTLTLPFGTRLIDVSEPAMIEWVQKTNFSNYMKGPKSKEAIQDVFGHGIFAADGDQWSIQRKTTSHIFTANSFNGVISDSISGDLIMLDMILKDHASNSKRGGEEFDLSGLFFDFTLSSFVKMAFSRDIHSLALPSSNRPAPNPFIGAFDQAQAYLTTRATNPIWKLTDRFTAGGRQMMRNVEVLDSFAFGVIDERIKERGGKVKGKKGVGREGEGKGDLLDIYLKASDSTGMPISRKGLRDNVLNIIIAGRDTTAQALSWTFFRLLSNRELLKPIIEEIDNFFASAGPGEEVEGEGGAKKVDYRNYKNFVQCEAAICEGLRLHPSVPKASWEAKADDQIPGGPFVHAGDRVRWSDWQMARDPLVWGKDCCEYKPSRWIDDEGNLIRFGSYKFHAFNSGYRLCLGQNLALFEAVSVLVTILRKYELSFCEDYLSKVEKTNLEGEESAMYLTSLTLPMKEPLRVVANLRSV